MCYPSASSITFVTSISLQYIDLRLHISILITISIPVVRCLFVSTLQPQSSKLYLRLCLISNSMSLSSPSGLLEMRGSVSGACTPMSLYRSAGTILMGLPSSSTVPPGLGLLFRAYLISYQSYRQLNNDISLTIPHCFSHSA